MSIKTTLSVLLLTALLLAAVCLTACGSQTPPDDGSETTAATENTTKTPDTDPTPGEDETQTALTAYFKEVYGLYNHGDYEAHLAHFRSLTDNVHERKLRDFVGMAQFYRTYYAMDTLEYQTMEDGRLLVTVKFYVKYDMASDGIDDAFSLQTIQFVVAETDSGYAIDGDNIIASEDLTPELVSDIRFGED